MPVEFHVSGLTVGSVFLDAVADISEDFGFGWIVDFGMIFNFIDGSEAQICRGDGLLAAGGELDDGNVEGSWGLFEDFEGSLFFCFHFELFVQIDNIIKLRWLGSFNNIITLYLNILNRK